MRAQNIVHAVCRPRQKQIYSAAEGTVIRKSGKLSNQCVFGPKFNQLRPVGDLCSGSGHIMDY